MADDDYAPGSEYAPGTEGPASSPGDSGFTYTGPHAEVNDGKSVEDLQDQIRANKSAVPSGGTGASGGGYQCSLGELRQLIGQVDNMVYAARSDMLQAETIAETKPPAQDAAASVYHATGLSRWGAELVDAIQQRVNDLGAFAEHLRSTERTYANQEDSTQIRFKDFEGKL